MKKLGLMLLSIAIVMGCLPGCHKVEMTEADKERTEYVKDTILGYGMVIQTEVTPETLEENKKNTDDIVSFGKKQIYELSCGNENDEESNTLFYHKFENSKGGKKEAEKLYSAFKDSINILPDNNTTEATDTETGNKSYTSRSKTTGSTETFETTEDDTDVSVVLIYNAEKNEVAVMANYEKLPSDNIDAMTDNVMRDLGWTYLD